MRFAHTGVANLKCQSVGDTQAAPKFLKMMIAASATHNLRFYLKPEALVIVQRKNIYTKFYANCPQRRGRERECMMKKLGIGFICMLLLMITFACDRPIDNDGANTTPPSEITASDYGRMRVPTCGRFTLDAEGTYHTNRNLFVNWNGPGAPTESCNAPGFGNGEPRPFNAYSWAMTSFGDHVYVGVMNRINDGIHETGDISEGAEVWRYKPGNKVNSGKWEQELSGGFSRLSNYGIRAMAVYKNQLYAGTFNLAEGTELWRRTMDTESRPGQWEVLATGGFGDAQNDSARAMIEFNGKLYIGTKNNDTGARLFKFDADTQAVSLVAGGAAGVISTLEDVVSELAVFGDYLWVFTWGSEGFGAYRMDREENIEFVKYVGYNWAEWTWQDLRHWRQTIERLESDAGMDIDNSGIMSSAVLNDKIYLGTVNLMSGAEMFVLENPNAADPNAVTWTRIGANVFQSTENYLWRMQVFNGQLYIGTWNPYDSYEPLKSMNNVGATLYRMDKDEYFCQVMGHRRLIEEGFDKPENYGIRSMAEHNGRLYIGTAQPFKIEPGIDDTAAANREGTEVWEFDPAN